MKSIRLTVIGVVAAAAALGVVAPTTAQAAPRSVAAVQTGHHHHRHCDGDRDRDDWFCCCDRDRGHDRDRDCRRHHHHGVEAGGGGMAALVASRTSHIGG